MDKEWTEKLKDIMATFEEKEPSGLWNDIMKALPDGDIANAMHTNSGEKTFEKSSDRTSRRNAHTQSRKKILFIRIASVAVAAIAILMFHIVKTTNITDNGITTGRHNHAMKTDGIEGNRILKDENSQSQQNTMTNKMMCFMTDTQHGIGKDIHSEGETESLLSTERFIQHINKEGNSNNVNLNEYDSDNKQIAEKKQRPNRQRHTLDNPLFDTYNANTENSNNTYRRKMSLNLYASNTLSNSSTSTSGILGNHFVMQSEPSAMGYAYAAPNIQNSNPISTLNNEEKNGNIKTKHHSPLRIGITADYEIGKNISIGSGLYYSLLSSDFSIDNGIQKQKSRQKLHYLGIPAYISVNLIRKGRISWYCTAGGMVEKNIKGTVKTDFLLNDNVYSTTEENVRDTRLQFSVNGSTGIKYGITDNISLYVEPELNYSFDNGSNIENAYKEQPLDINLKIGIKMDIKH